MIPDVDDLCSATLVHRFGDLFSPPALTNFLGSVQAAVDLTGIRSLNFPPFGSSDSFPPVTWADSLTGALFLDGRYLTATGMPVEFEWRPDRIRRRGEYAGLRLESETILVPDRRACLVRLTIENRSGEARRIRLGFGVKATVTSNLADWDDAIAPAEGDNEVVVDASRAALAFRARHTNAVSLQGVVPRVDTVERARLETQRRLMSGERWTLTYVNVIDSTVEAACAVYDRIAATIDASFGAARDEWNRELAAMFTPGNDRFSGHLPVLETENTDLRALYWNGALATVYFKRKLPHAVLDRVYTTLMPRYWPTLTWLWDFELGSTAFALLDPDVMRRQVEHWMGWDVQSFMATDWLTGRGVGHWYAVNDNAMSKLIRDYVRWSGDKTWLNHPVISADGSPRTVMEAAVGYARAWRRRCTVHGLADYGSMSNLLECVPGYAHEVAGLNALNVASLEGAAELLCWADDDADVTELRAEARGILDAVQRLYIDGAGYWSARQPDGSLLPIRHCVDALWVLNAIGPVLDARQRDEITRFVMSELCTEGWLHALSPMDADAVYDVRPDHQWSGSYVAWPPEIATGLCRIGRSDAVVDWLPGLARAAKQGPFGQAHFVESVIAGDGGGARKAPSDFPYLTDWACSAGAAWVRFLIEGVFGVDAAIDGNMVARPTLGALDPHAKLSGLRYRDRLFDVDANGLRTRGAR